MQLRTGNLLGTVADQKGRPLPGAVVTLTGDGAPQVQVTNAQGQFRFLGLMPGTYALKAELEGFVTAHVSDVEIGPGRNTDIPITLQPAVIGTPFPAADPPLPEPAGS